jgi:hypothetical protein
MEHPALSEIATFIYPKRLRIKYISERKTHQNSFRIYCEQNKGQLD